jgi:hypothetical protein
VLDGTLAAFVEADELAEDLLVLLADGLTEERLVALLTRWSKAWRRNGPLGGPKRWTSSTERAHQLKKPTFWARAFAGSTLVCEPCDTRCASGGRPGTRLRTAVDCSAVDCLQGFALVDPHFL